MCVVTLCTGTMCLTIEQKQALLRQTCHTSLQFISELLSNTSHVKTRVHIKRDIISSKQITSIFQLDCDNIVVVHNIYISTATILNVCIYFTKNLAE